MKSRIKTFMDWYTRPEVKFEIIKFLRDRELACLVPSWCPEEMKKKSTRTLRCHSVQHYDIILFKILDVKYKQTLYNLYYSMAKYMQGLPYQNPNLAERDTKGWKENHHEQMIGYDWLIDIDAGSHEDIMYAHESADMVKRLLDRYKISYELRFSGCGFHIVVPYRVISGLQKHFNPFQEGSYFEALTTMSKALNEKYSELIDWKIPDSRRVSKLPYSLAFYPNAEYVCLPFINTEEFYKFELEDMRPEKWEGLLRDRCSTVFNYIDMPDLNGLLKKLEVSFDG